MRTGTTLSARQDWFDRNPTPRIFLYASAFVGIAPAAFTQRWTYTTPAGKKFYVQSTFLTATRVTAAAPVGMCGAELQYTPSGGAATTLLQSLNLQNTIGASQSYSLGAGVVMLAGDTLTGNTFDFSTGGTVAYVATVQGIEFDA